MKRRDFIKVLGAGALASTGLIACGSKDASEQSSVKRDARKWRWKMVTTWPMNFPGLGTGANLLARLITEMSGGRITVKVYGAGELVPALEAFDAVANRVVELGHGAAYYWKGKAESSQFFAAVPFGMNGQEMNAWLYYGGGNELWREVYEPFGIVPAACGNSGVQMGGWFNREINSLDDLNGLKMRIPGLGAEVLHRAGGLPVTLPGGEIFTALQTGAIDATEWVGPYNDLAFGLHKAARYYYYPGWHEPGSVLEAIISKAALDELPPDLQSIVLNACRVVNEDMLAEYTARNHAALNTLVNEHGVQLRRFPQQVMDRMKVLALQVLDEIAARDRMTARVYASYKKFQQQVKAWHDVSERAYYDMR